MLPTLRLWGSFINFLERVVIELRLIVEAEPHPSMQGEERIIAEYRSHTCREYTMLRLLN